MNCGVLRGLWGSAAAAADADAAAADTHGLHQMVDREGAVTL